MSTTREFAVLVVGLIVVGIVLNAFFGVVTDVGASQDVSEDVVLGGDGAGALSYSGPVSNFDAVQSLGTGVHLTGASDSEVSGGEIPDPDETWTVTTWGELDESANNTTERRLLQLDDWLYVDYNNTTWRVTYYETDDLEVHQVSINAPDPYNVTHLAIRGNDSHLVIFRNKTKVKVASLASGGDSIPDAKNWHGDVEETRLLDSEANRSVINETYDTPTTPLTQVPRSDKEARIMFDLRSGETAVDVFWTGSDMQRSSNTSIVAGFDGQSISEKTVLFGDYVFDDETDTVKATDGGKLDGAPVVYVAYTEEVGGSLGGVVEGAGETAGAALSLLSVGAIIIAARELLEF